MSYTCPKCGATATELTATPQQATYRGGCQHIEIVTVDGEVRIALVEKG